jgi:hypothetical protein
VLAHVKQHYHEAGLMLENAKNQFLTTSLTESLIAAALQQNSAAQPMMTTPVAATAASAAVASPPTMVSSAGAGNSGGRQQHGGGTKRENGETNNETSTHQHGGRGVWRGPAPYRCGHCKQVSNWKHVIQVLTNQNQVGVQQTHNCLIYLTTPYGSFPPRTSNRVNIWQRVIPCQLDKSMSRWVGNIKIGMFYGSYCDSKKISHITFPLNCFV